MTCWSAVLWDCRNKSAGNFGPVCQMSLTAANLEFRSLKPVCLGATMTWAWLCFTSVAQHDAGLLVSPRLSQGQKSSATPYFEFNLRLVWLKAAQPIAPCAFHGKTPSQKLLLRWSALSVFYRDKGEGEGKTKEAISATKSFGDSSQNSPFLSFCHLVSFIHGGTLN